MKDRGWTRHRHVSSGALMANQEGPRHETMQLSTGELLDKIGDRDDEGADENRGDNVPEHEFLLA